MKKDYKIPGYCGIICDRCGFYTGEKSPSCPGCLVCASKPFWGICKTASCAISKNVEHCGLCEDFPCTLLPEQFDPSNQRGKEEAIFRIGQLAIRAKIGTKKWLQQRANGKLVGFTVDEL